MPRLRPHKAQVAVRGRLIVARGAPVFQPQKLSKSIAQAGVSLYCQGPAPNQPASLAVRAQAAATAGRGGAPAERGGPAAVPQSNSGGRNVPTQGRRSGGRRSGSGYRRGASRALRRRRRNAAERAEQDRGLSPGCAARCARSRAGGCAGARGERSQAAHRRAGDHHQRRHGARLRAPDRRGDGRGLDAGRSPARDRQGWRFQGHRDGGQRRHRGLVRGRAQGEEEALHPGVRAGLGNRALRPIRGRTGGRIDGNAEYDPADREADLQPVSMPQAVDETAEAQEDSDAGAVRPSASPVELPSVAASTKLRAD